MRYAHITSAQNYLLKPHIISVEIDLSKGLHSFFVVGLPDKGVEESRDRVSAAIKNSGFKSPKQTNAKIVVSLAPAELRKEGPSFDLPIALSYLLAADEIDFDPEGKLFAGELALDGTVRPIRGSLSFARLAQEKGIREMYVPKENAREAALIKGVTAYGVESLEQIILHLDPTLKGNAKGHIKIQPTPYHEPHIPEKTHDSTLDEIVGQDTAKRGLIIAAAGGHNVALFGPPGTGKTMLARALQSILPTLSFSEILEVTEIYSAAGQLDQDLVTHPPVRAPHHTASYASVIGGGNVPRPGEITLGHRGILFLDEFPEFDQRVIEALRQPLEDKVISVSRSKGSAKFPADFILVAAMNPCPCGNRGTRGKTCICTAKDIARYERRISGPIMDRIDMWIEVSEVDHEKLMQKKSGSIETEQAKTAVIKARAIQKRRFTQLGIKATSNASVRARDMADVMKLSPEAETTIQKAAKSYGLSGRGYHRTIKLARTIADVSGSENIEALHILEALQYRQKHF